MVYFRTLTAALVLWAMLGGVMPSARADWEYARQSKGKNPQGTLTTTERNGKTYVSIRQFCFALGCRVFYQWANQRAIVQNPEHQGGAIVSSIARLALVDGRVVDFEGEVITDSKEGYLLPMDLAVKLAPAMKLGKLTSKQESKKPPVIDDQSSSLQTIVIDPGHGGNDFGTGFGAIHEKDVALVYAMRLEEELKKEMPEVSVVLTRQSDVYVSLPDRAKLANSKGANLFLSLHVNHAPNASIEGAETYILNPEATDDEAKKLALLENDTWLKSSGIKEGGDIIKQILVDMEQTKYIQRSALVASLLQKELIGMEPIHGLKSRGVKQAMFYVLSQVAMPSALIEMGFLSNTGDRSRLMSVAFRDEFVKRVISAIKEYRNKLKAKEVTS